MSEFLNHLPNVEINLSQNSNKSDSSYFSMRNKIPDRDNGVISVDLVDDLYEEPQH